MTLAIRPAGPSDADAIAGLVDRAYTRWIEVIGRPPKPMLADYRAAVADHLVFVLDDRERLGVAAVIELVPETDHMLIANIAVDPPRQRSGIGRTLLAFAEAEALARGLTETRLYTNALMQANVALYERIGYSVTERRRIDRLDSTIVFMAKPLRPQLP